MATPAIILIKQLATTFFLVMYLVTICFQGLEFGYCVFLLSRQCDKSKHFKTLKLRKKVCLKFKSTIWGSWTPVSNLRLFPMQSSVSTDSPTQPTRTKFQPWMIQAANKIQELRKSRKKPQSSNPALNSYHTLC